MATAEYYRGFTIEFAVDGPHLAVKGEPIVLPSTSPAAVPHAERAMALIDCAKRQIEAHDEISRRPSLRNDRIRRLHGG